MSAIAPVAAACVTAFATVGAVLITYYLTKKKDRDAEWRKVKTEYYQEFLQALSAWVTTKEQGSGARYVNATNMLNLIASARVIKALRAFQKAVRAVRANGKSSIPELDSLLMEIRRELHPGRREKGEGLEFPILDLADHDRDR
ncbi:MAG: hypothetical protein JO110_08685 [Acetobacteraceae bacterium]|nr:hypothetical protein [Acetobacteraceae bacterium]